MFDDAGHLGQEAAARGPRSGQYAQLACREKRPQQAFGQGLVLSGGEAGLHLVMWLPDELPDLAVAQRAAQLGLGVRPLSAYARPPVRCNGLVLGYGNLDEGAVGGAVARLKRAVEG